MIKKRKVCVRRTVLLLVMFAGLVAIGVTYAAWTERLNLTGSVTTGRMNIVYSEKESCSVSILDMDGMVAEEAHGIDARVQDDGKTVEITVSDALAAEKILEDSEYLIRLVCPLEAGEDNTVNRVRLSEVDFEQEAAEEAVFEPEHIVFLAEADGEEYELPGDAFNGFGQPLTFDVFREIREQDEIWFGVIYLRLRDESRADIDGFSTDMFFEEWELPTEALDVLEDEEEYGLIHGQIAVTYRCTLPVYIEQEHE